MISFSYECLSVICYHFRRHHSYTGGPLGKDIRLDVAVIVLTIHTDLLEDLIEIATIPSIYVPKYHQPFQTLLIVTKCLPSDYNRASRYEIQNELKVIGALLTFHELYCLLSH